MSENMFQMHFDGLQLLVLDAPSDCPCRECSTRQRVFEGDGITFLLIDVACGYQKAWTETLSAQSAEQRFKVAKHVVAPLCCALEESLRQCNVTSTILQSVYRQLQQVDDARADHIHIPTSVQLDQSADAFNPPIDTELCDALNSRKAELFELASNRQLLNHKLSPHVSKTTDQLKDELQTGVSTNQDSITEEQRRLEFEKKLAHELNESKRRKKRGLIRK